MVKKQSKKKNRFSKFLYLLLVVVTTLFIAALWYLDMIPSKYFLLVICVTVFIVGIFGIILLNNKAKKRIKTIFGFISIIIISLMSFVGYNAFNVKDFINNVTKQVNYKIENYSVIVLADKKYEKIEDIKGKKLGYLDNETNGMKKSLEMINNKVSINGKDYDDIEELSKELIDEKIESILIEDSYKKILDEQYDKFKNNTKVLYTFSVKVLENKQAKKVDVTREAFNVYISGIDTYGKIASVSRSDVNILATINPTTHKVLLTSIPRDYYVTLHTFKQKDKLTHAGIYGIDESLKTIEDLLDLNINYYVKVNFTSMENLVDEIGGITVNSDYNFTSEDGYKYVKGKNQMNGKRALSFARERHAFKDGDIQRGKNQMYVISALADEMMTFSKISKFNSLLNAIDGSFETNMSSDEISKLIKMQINDMIIWQIDNNYLEGTGSSETTYTIKSARSYVMEPDVPSIVSAKTKISKVVNEH